MGIDKREDTQYLAGATVASAGEVKDEFVVECMHNYLGTPEVRKEEYIGNTWYKGTEGDINGFNVLLNTVQENK